MNRTDELRKIYENSGLDEIVVKHEIEYFEEKDFTKLKLEPNDFGVRSIELWDLKRGGTYFRIHHLEKAPHWVSEAMQGWEGRRNTSSTFGSNFDGDPLKPARLLAELLRSKR